MNTLVALDGSGGAEGGTADAPRRGAPPPASALPCQNRNNSIPQGYRLTPILEREGMFYGSDGRTWDDFGGGVFRTFDQLTSAERKSAFQLRGNVDSFVREFGSDHCAFWTLTDLEGLTPKEFARRWNSLIANHGEWIMGFIRVLEPQRNGNPHYHILVAVPWDMLPNKFDWDAFDAAAKQKSETKAEFKMRRSTPEWQALRKRYADSAAPEVREMWKRLYPILKNYGLGRSEFVPVRKAGAITHYIGKYLEAGIQIRIQGWKGARRVETDRRTSKIWKSNGRQFSWVTPGAKEWRKRVGAIAKLLGVTSLDGIKKALGPKWAYWARGYITASQEEWDEVYPHLLKILVRANI